MGVRITAQTPGAADALVPEQFIPGEPGPKQILVQTTAVGVNFIDTYFRSGTYSTTFPYTPGTEGSGTVIACGSEVTEFSNGDTIMWNAAPHSYATHVLVPSENAVRIPAHIDPVTAAAIPLQGLTAHYLATSAYHISPDDVVLIHAGAGGVGLLLTQIAKILGAFVITTVSTSEKEELSLNIGADRVIRYDQLTDLRAQLPALVRELSDELRNSNALDPRGSGVDAVFDGVGRTTFDASLASLRVRGTLVLFGGSSGQVEPFDLQRLNASGSISVVRPSLGHYILNRQELETRSADLLTWLGQGTLQFRVGATFPLNQASAAHIALESRSTTGKILLIP